MSLSDPGINFTTPTKEKKAFSDQPPYTKTQCEFNTSLQRMLSYKIDIDVLTDHDVDVECDIDDDIQSCVITLCKILDNILLETSYNLKTRSIRLRNKLFHDKISKVPGGVDFLLACKFIYTTIISSSKSVSSNISSSTANSADTPRTTPKKNAIQLTKENEDKNVLILGRTYLQRFGQLVLHLEVGKNKNQLPNLHTFQTINTVFLINEIDQSISSFFKEYMKNSKLKDCGEDQNLNNYKLNEQISTPKKVNMTHNDRKSSPRRVTPPNEPNEENNSTLSHTNKSKESSTNEIKSSISSGSHITSPESTSNEQRSISSYLEKVSSTINNKGGHEDDEWEDKTVSNHLLTIDDNNYEVNDVTCNVNVKQPMKVSTLDIESPTKKHLSSVPSTPLIPNDKTSILSILDENENLLDTQNDDKTVLSVISDTFVKRDNDDQRHLFFTPKSSAKSKCYESSSKINDHSPDYIEQASIFSSSSDQTDLKMGLKLFFSIFAVIWNNPTRFFADNKLSIELKEDELSNVPLEIVFLLWSAVSEKEPFHSNSNFDAICAQFISATNYPGHDDYLPNEILQGTDALVCNSMCEILCKIELIERMDFRLNDDEYTSANKRRTLIRLKNPQHYQYGNDLILRYFSKKHNTSNNIMDSVRSSWSQILFDVLIQNLGLSIDIQSNINEVTSSGVSSLSSWYLVRWIPMHMMITKEMNKAVSLLIDETFLTLRFRSCGDLVGTLRYIHDIIHVADFFSHIQDPIPSYSDNHINPNNNYVSNTCGASTLEAMYDSVISFLHNKKKNISSVIVADSERNSTFTSAAGDVFELGQALHYLAVSIGEELGKFSVEVDLHIEAHRLKILAGEFIDNKFSVAFTLFCMGTCYHNAGELGNAMARYKEALDIYNSLPGENNDGVAKIYYNMGVVLFEKKDYDEANYAFERSLTLFQNLHVRADKNIVDTICWIGKVHREKKDYKQSYHEFQKALHLLDNITDKDKIEFAEIFYSLGDLQNDMGNVTESLQCYQECLRIQKQWLSYHDESICKTLSGICNVYKKFDIGKALKLHEIVLRYRMRNNLTSNSDYKLVLRSFEDILYLKKVMLETNCDNPTLHDEIATLMVKIGHIYEKVNELATAILYYNGGLKIRKMQRDLFSVGNILNSLGILHAKRKSYDKAMKCFDDSSIVRKSHLGDDHLDVAETLHNMGNCSAKQGFFSSAAEYYLESLKIKRLRSGDESISTMKTLHNLGLVYEEMGKDEEAMNCYIEALNVRISLLGADHLDISFSLHCVGSIHRKQGNLQLGLDCLLRSLRIKRQFYQGDHVSIAETMFQLGNILKNMNKNDEAIEYFEHALSTFEKRLLTHNNATETLDALGSLYLSRDESDRAQQYLQKSIALKRLMSGDEINHSICDTMYLIGKAQSKSGELDESLQTLKEVLRLRKEFDGKDSLSVAAVINDVGVSQLRKGEFVVAKKCFEEAMRIWDLLLGDNHAFLGDAFLNLGEIAFSLNNYDDATELFTKSLSALKSKQGMNDLSVGLLYFKLGKCYIAQKEIDLAVAVFEKSLSIRTLHLGSVSTLVAEILKELGSLYLDKEDYLKARDYLGECLNIMVASCPSDLKTSDALFLLGRVMFKMSYIDEAISYLNDALSIRRKRLDVDDLNVADILVELAQINESTKSYRTSLEFYTKALEIRSSHGTQDFILADTYHNIGAIQNECGKYNDALKSFGTALSLYQKCYGDDHLSCAKTMNNIGIIYDATQEFDESLKYFKEGLRLRKLHLGNDHLKLANSLDNIARVYQQKKDNEMALKSLKEALRIRILRLGNEHFEVATTLFGMGIVYCDINLYDKAMECYEVSLDIRKRIGKSSIEVAQTLHNMGSIYALQQDYANALELWHRSLQTYREAGFQDEHHMVACTLGNIEMATNLLNGIE